MDLRFTGSYNGNPMAVGAAQALKARELEKKVKSLDVQKLIQTPGTF